ncbi:gamma-glutamyltransferase family protein [Dichotomicrobium thermohalophilum]|uniref:Gamma-glutamyltransferase 2 n=1 Tax=Dichotomicrobium thermohalophilum TaxID=933063 RepID=A0A397Q1K8_9HYPH|nr:gamma-glutamyltransferase family protein [Dichotomicrobium thermohalophilum]RIA55390.1 gamma-glutamyltransferase 2 [Dichotomicrobium thermohalophilum]
MLDTLRSKGAMITAPHHLAAQSGLAVMREGGNALEAMIAAAATVAVIYPHMNAIGGDGFWLIAEPGQAPVGIDACGPAAALADSAFYEAHGVTETIPARGGLAALTVAGTIAGWEAAHALAQEAGGRLPLERLLADAVHYAREGIVITDSMAALTESKRAELAHAPGFAETFLLGGQALQPGAVLRQPRLADTLAQLSRAGLRDFYDGDIARALAYDLEAAGSPVRLTDLEGFAAQRVAPISVALDAGTLYNMPPPTQGLASLLILAIYERLRAEQAECFDHVHRIVEATKRAFLIRDAHVTDPRFASAAPADFLTPERIAAEAEAIDVERAAPWPAPAPGGNDTIWMGAVDADGRVVSFIQSIYWEYGSGVVSPATGVLWQNRGISFSLDPSAGNPLQPGRKPFHTLNPALARFSDGRVMTYGTKGGEGQPQTQAAIFSRYAMHGQPLQHAVTAPRWLLGRTWGEQSTSLKIEDGFGDDLIARLRHAGHDVEVTERFAQMMGHAGAIVRRPDGTLEGASDPRSDGSVAAL